jgi:2-oxoglutarate dehydrogenase E1 component
LETVDPVVYGKVRALQDFDEDLERRKNIGIVLHGDAAHAGQGVVYETYQFQDLKCYTSGGIIHIITNNQIGFTTTQRDARSGLYCTEVAKTIMAPIFHVNADDPIMVDKVIRMSLKYRQMFNKDVVIDIVGYRKYGHNELD